MLLAEVFLGPFATLPVAVLAIDADGRPLVANRRFHHLVGSTRLPGLDELADALGVEAWTRAAAGVAGSGERTDFSLCLMRADRSLLSVKVSMQAVVSPDGDLEHVLASITDIHEYECEAEAQRLELEATAAELRARSEFVAMISHEFKNGLTGMAGFAEMIRDFDLELPTIKEYAGDILNDAHRMSRMLAELLELARLESGQMRLQVAPADLNCLVETQVRRLVAARSPVVFEAGPLPPVLCDQDRTIQVVANLLSNALKYSPEGGRILVRTRACAGFAEVAVLDQGLGIPPDEIEHVFERFHRVDKGAAGKITGTGLGLAISREITQLQGGRMSVESTYGQGSTFAFTIPLATLSQAVGGLTGVPMEEGLR